MRYVFDIPALTTFYPSNRCPVDKACKRYEFLNDGKGVHIFRILKVIIMAFQQGIKCQIFKIYNPNVPTCPVLS